MTNLIYGYIKLALGLYCNHIEISMPPPKIYSKLAQLTSHAQNISHAVVNVVVQPQLIRKNEINRKIVSLWLSK